MSEDEEKAYRYAVKLLSYADNTAAALYAKLLSKGFAEDTSRAAVSRLASEGFLNEERMVRRQVEKLYAKLYGPGYILAVLESRSFSKRAMKFASDMISDLDFEKTASEYRKLQLKEGKNERQIASGLIRRGFTEE